MRLTFRFDTKVESAREFRLCLHDTACNIFVESALTMARPPEAGGACDTVHCGPVHLHVYSLVFHVFYTHTRNNFQL